MIRNFSAVEGSKTTSSINHNWMTIFNHPRFRSIVDLWKFLEPNLNNGNMKEKNLSASTWRHLNFLVRSVGWRMGDWVRHWIRWTLPSPSVCSVRPLVSSIFIIMNPKLKFHAEHGELNLEAREKKLSSWNFHLAHSALSAAGGGELIKRTQRTGLILCLRWRSPSTQMEFCYVVRKSPVNTFLFRSSYIYDALEVYIADESWITKCLEPFHVAHFLFNEIEIILNDRARKSIRFVIL